VNAAFATLCVPDRPVAGGDWIVLQIRGNRLPNVLFPQSIAFGVVRF